MDANTQLCEGKWHQGISAEGLRTLGEVSREVNAIHSETRQTVSRAVLEIGRRLQVARALFKGDKEYGQWCAEVFPWANRTMLYNAWALAGQVGDRKVTTKLIDALPISAVFEVVSASDTVRKRIEQAIDSDEAPTVADIRRMKKDERAVPGAADARPAAPSASGGPSDPDPVPPPRSPLPARPEPARAVAKTTDPMADIKASQALINRPFHDRLRSLMQSHPDPDTRTAYVLLGLDPDPCCYPSPFTIDIIYDKYSESLAGKNDPEAVGYFVKCIKLIEEDRKEFH